LKTGKAAYYDENGQIKSKGLLEENLRVKTWVFYDENGHQIDKSKYKNGVTKVSDKILQKFIGQYQVGDEKRHITFQNGQLFSKHSKSETKRPLIPISKNEFLFEDDANLKLTFVHNKNGEIIHHILKHRSTETIAQKIK